MSKYKVRFDGDSNYKVVRILTEAEAVEAGSIERLEKAWDGEGYEESEFWGGLADCEAYIRLHEGGYM